MKPEEENTFLALLRAPDVLLKSDYHYHNSFEEIKSFMEKEWPDLWEEYIKTHIEGLSIACTMAMKMNEKLQDNAFTLLLTNILNLKNLITFLLKKEQVEKWGWVEKYCAHCRKGEVQMHLTHPCEKCGAIGGRVKHPTLLYAEGL